MDCSELWFPVVCGSGTRSLMCKPEPFLPTAKPQSTPPYRRWDQMAQNWFYQQGTLLGLSRASVRWMPPFCSVIVCPHICGMSSAVGRGGNVPSWHWNKVEPVPRLGLRASPSGCSSSWELGMEREEMLAAELATSFPWHCRLQEPGPVCAFQAAPCLHNKLHSSSPLEFLGTSLVQIIVKVL